jgi:polar amino acid transport system substrate-binding protein
VTDAPKELLAPGGTLRAAINTGNAVLAQLQPDGSPSGVTVDLAREFARRLGVSCVLRPYDAAGKVVNAAKDDVWDVGFLAIDPLRATEIEYTRPYVLIEGAFAVPEGSRFRKPDELNQPGVRIGVGEGAAYDLHLTRTFTRAELVRYRTSANVFKGTVEDKLDAAAGIRQPVAAFAARTPGYRVLPEAFMAIRQAVAVPKAKAAAAPWLQAQLDELLRSGFVRAALERAGQDPDVAAPV